jgi:hypothetical protein
MEQELAGFARGLQDGVTGAVLTEVVSDPGLQAVTSAAARSGPERLRSGGVREVSVTMLGGHEARLRTEYLKPDRRGRPGRPRGTGRRGAGGAGLYPVLAALGILNGVTPAAAAEITRQVTDSDSVRSGREALARRGLDLGHKQTLRIVNAVGQRAVAQRDSWLDRVRTGTFQPTRVLLIAPSISPSLAVAIPPGAVARGGSGEAWIAG